MRFRIGYFVLTVMLILSLVAVKGEMTEDNNTTWAEIQVITGRYNVNEGEQLIIEPGTTIKFDEVGSLYIKGTLIAIGTPEKPITFTSNSTTPYPGIWDKINFKGSASKNCIMKYCKLEYAAQGISISAPYVKIEYCTITNVEKYGIKIQQKSTSYIANNTITTQNIAIRVATDSKPLIVNNILQGNSFYGIYNDDRAEPEISRNQISNSEWGIYSHLAAPIINNNNIENCSFGILNYLSNGSIEGNKIQNSKEYGIKCRYSEPKIINNIISSSGKDGIFAYHSSPYINGNIISDNEMWGIVNLGAISNLGENDFNTSTQNKQGMIRQGWYLTVFPKDNEGNILRNVEITIFDKSDSILEKGNTGNADYLTFDLTEYVVKNDNTLSSESEYKLNFELDGYESKSETVVLTGNKNLDLTLIKKPIPEKESGDDAIPGFGIELIILGIGLTIFLYGRRQLLKK